MNIFYRKTGGFTLIELMIAVAVIALLSALAYPSYMDSVRKSRRTDGESALMNAAQRMEVYYARNASYAGATIGSGASDTISPKSEEGYYSISFSGTPSTSTYVLLATAIGDQAKDKVKGFRLDQTGKKERTLDGSTWVTGWKE